MGLHYYRVRAMAVCGKLINKIYTALAGVSSDAWYIISFMMYLFTTAVNSTMFTVPNFIYKLCFAGMFLGLFIHIILYVRYSREELIFAVVFAGIAMLLYIRAGYMDPMIWAMFLFGAKGVSFKRILMAYVLTVGGIVLLAFLGAFIGVIENLRYTAIEENDEYIRNAFGMVYTTDCAAHIFYLMAVVFYLFKGKLKTIHYVLSLLLALFFWYFCRTRDDCISMAVLAAGFYILDHRRPAAYCPRTRYKKSALPELAAWFMPVSAVCMIAVTWIYDETSTWMYDLNDFISNRLALGHTAITRYGPKLFGQYIKMVGFGGSTRKRADYFFLDSTYVNIFMRYGIIFGLITLGIFVLSSRKYKSDAYFLMCIFVIALNSVIAHHLIELAYNPFALALFAAAKACMAEKPCKL